MAERVVDAGFSDGVGRATFFLTDQYVVYDYVADRMRDGIHPVTSFPPGSAGGFPTSFAPGGPATVIDAALRGKRRFAGRSYFFSGSQYVGLDEAPGTVDAAPRPVPDGWNVPAGFTAYSAAWNGALNRDAFCYLFGGSQYLRYIWDDDQTDVGFPKQISNMVGMPATFASGVDAAVDGAGPFADASYLFKDDSYLRFQWVAAGEPHADGTSKIQDGWPGLMEMLLAAKAKSNALLWVGTALQRIAQHNAGTISPADEVVLAAALLTHFKTTAADAASLATVNTVLGLLETTLRGSASTMRFRTAAEMASDLAQPNDAAYTIGSGAGATINVTANFPKRPELNRVSSLIHESVHANDPNSGTPNVHISEWYVSPALAPALGLTPVADMPGVFATRYDLMSTADSLHNPSSYATFARHLFFGNDSRENI